VSSRREAFVAQHAIAPLPGTGTPPAADMEPEPPVTVLASSSCWMPTPVP